MKTLLIALMFAQPGLTPTEEALLDQAVNNCTRWNGKRVTTAHEEMLREMLLIERELDFPEEARGLILAAACWESAYMPGAQGDCTILGRCKSVGILQFGAWARRHIRGHQLSTDADSVDPRLDWRASAYYWGAHLLRSLKKVQRACQYLPWHWSKGSRGRLYGSKTAKQIAAANAHAVRYPKCRRYHRGASGRYYCVERLVRCWETTGHWRELSKWRGEIDGAEVKTVHHKAGNGLGT
jgi:hypothetical protein